MKKLLFCAAFFFSLSKFFAFNIGFSSESSFVFLEKSEEPFRPDVARDFEFSVFSSFTFYFKGQSLFLEPALYLKSSSCGESEILPYFRRFRYSLFIEHFSFALSKDVFSSGEGKIMNNFFPLLPEAAKESFLWHVNADAFVKRFSFNVGGAADTKRLDSYKAPLWYSVWCKIVYSNPAVSVGAESDLLIETADMKKSVSYISKSAAELSLTLPRGITLYTNAKLPFSFAEKKFTDRAVLLGFSKLFSVKDNFFTLFLETGYAEKVGFKYGIFQLISVKGVSSFYAGVQGTQKNEINVIFTSDFSIERLKFSLSYISENLLSSPIGGGVLKIGVLLNANN